jgi:outer membrane protein assembly factor BamE (lipoprotein component of BamABCDE complex)
MGIFRHLVNRRAAPRTLSLTPRPRHWRLPVALSATAGLALAACSIPIDQRGNLPEKTTLDQIQPGVTDKATVTRLLGSPSSIAAFDANTWYYISQKSRAVAFFKPQLLDQEVVAVDFDKDGLVRDVRHRGMQDAQAVTPNPNATPAPGREFSFIEQLIGNFGKFSGKGQAPGGGGGAGGGGTGGGPGGYP